MFHRERERLGEGKGKDGEVKGGRRRRLVVISDVEERSSGKEGEEENASEVPTCTVPIRGFSKKKNFLGANFPLCPSVNRCPLQFNLFFKNIMLVPLIFVKAIIIPTIQI